MRCAVWIGGSVLAFLCAAFPASSEAQRRVPAPRPGTLAIEGAQVGPEVFVDEEPVGAMPIDPISLAPGDHTVRVTQSGFTDFTDVVTIASDRTTTLEVELLAVVGVLHLETDPTGAQIFVDERFMGESPFSADLNEGEHSLRVRLTGYLDVERVVRSVAGVTERLELTLQTIPEPELPRATPWYEEPVTWIAIGSGVVVVAVAIVVAAVLAQPNGSPVDAYCMGMCVRLQER